MSNNTSNEININLNEMVIPNLGGDYAEGLNSALNTIRNNFNLLANHNFVKGDAGASIVIRSVDLKDNNDLCEAIKTAVLEGYDEHEKDTELNGVGVFDNFDSNPGHLQMIYSVDYINGTETPVSSMYYVFLDSRFANNNIGNIASSDFSDVTDLSCALIYTEVTNDGNTSYKFERLTNAFPTIYYEPSIGLCWKLNGCETGLAVQGIPGKDGRDSTIEIVKIESGATNDEPKILKIHKGSGFNSLYDDNGKLIDAAKNYVNRTALVLKEVEVDSVKETHFYFGTIAYKDEVKDENGTITTPAYLYAKTTTELPVDINIAFSTFTDYMKNIGTDSNFGSAPGLFLPINANNSNDIQNGEAEEPVHLFTTSAITSNKNDNTSGNKNDVLLFPVKDINEYDNDATVEKYLYLRVNGDNPGIKAYYNAIDEGKTNNRYNYTLKYKLVSVVNNINYFNNNAHDSLRFGSFAIDTENNSIIWNPDSTNKDIIELNDKNVNYIKFDDVNKTLEYSEIEYTTNHIDTIPSSFKSKIDNGGIYRWELWTESAKYDIDELLSTIPEESIDTQYDYGDAKTSCLNTIFTTTMTPGVLDEIMWFNGISLPIEQNIVNITNNADNEATEEKYNNEPEIVVEEENTDTEVKYLLYGWHTGIMKSEFKFIKFVPIYNIADDTKYNEDNSLNINYNINVTGNNLDAAYKRNITVHGAVNCDDLSVYNLTATGEIKNIYTKDTIISDSGIKLGKINNLTEDSNIEQTEEIGREYSCEIDDNGNIKTASIIVDEYIESNTLNVKDTLSSNNVKVNSFSLVDSSKEIISANNGKLFLNDSKDINIKRKEFNSAIDTFANLSFDAESGLKVEVSLPSISINGSISSNRPIKPSVIPRNAGEETNNYNTTTTQEGTTPSYRRVYKVSNVSPSKIKSDMPLIQNNNSNIIVTNYDSVNDNLLPYYGVIRINSENDGGSGVSSDENIINSSDFDYAKNFNIHRISSKKTIEYKTKNIYNIHNHINNSDNTYFITDTLLKRSAEKLIGGGHKFVEELSCKTSIDKNNIESNNILQKFTIGQDTTKNTINFFDREQNIEIKFDKYFACNIAICGEVYCIVHPTYLYPSFTKSSNCEIELYYSYEEADGKTKVVKKIPINNQIYKLTETYDEDTYQNSNYTNAKLWGFTKYGKWWGNDCESHWRYYTYLLKPKDIIITPDNAEYNNIAYQYDLRKPITFYIVPKFDLTAYSQNYVNPLNYYRPDLITGITATNFVPLANIDNIKDGINNCDILDKLKTNSDKIDTGKLKSDKLNCIGYINWFNDSDESLYNVNESEDPNNKDSSSITYGISTDQADNNQDINENEVEHKENADATTKVDFKSTAVCNDGIVFRSGNTTFGIGYSNVIVDYTDNSIKDGHWNSENKIINDGKPVLFYHTYNTNMYNNDNEPNITNGKDLEGYARRTNAIPLDDLFDVVNYIKQTQSFKTWKGNEPYKPKNL